MDEQLAKLESLINRETQLHGAMLTLLKAKNEAVRQNEVKRMTQLCSSENEKVQELSEIAKQVLVGELTKQVKPDAKQPMRLIELIEALDEPARGRLLVLRNQLREQMLVVQKQTNLAKRASILRKIWSLRS